MSVDMKVKAIYDSEISNITRSEKNWKDVLTHIFISSFKAVGLRTNSIAQCEQLCDVKDTDLIEKIRKVSKNQLRQITKGMQIQLGMSTKHNNPIA